MNFDKELCGIKVLDHWKTEEERNDDPNHDWRVEGHAELVDIQCIRIVAANPAVNESDADQLFEYLNKLLERARKEG